LLLAQWIGGKVDNIRMFPTLFVEKPVETVGEENFASGDKYERFNVLWGKVLFCPMVILLVIVSFPIIYP
jgi:hypothetical protein